MTKRLYALALALLLVICLPGCDLQLPTGASEPSTEPTGTTAAQWGGYHGTSWKYVYCHTEERDRKWEEDVIYLADNYLDLHPLLTPYASLIQYHGYEDNSNDLYVEQMRTDFLQQINDLIPQIPELTDTQILYRLQKTVAMLRDAHSSLIMSSSKYFPIYYQVMYENDAPVLYTVVTEEKHSQLLFSTLEAINGIPTADLIALLGEYLSYENTYWLNSLAAGSYGLGYLSELDILQIVGVIGADEDSAQFRFRGGNGEEFTMELTALSESELQSANLTGYTPADAYPTMYKNYEQRNYWYELLDDDTLYIRFNRFRPEEDYTILDMGNEIYQKMRDRGGVENIIVDVRSNPGGYQSLGYDQFISVLGRVKTEQIYVLIDDTTFSNGIYTAASIEYYHPEAILVGTPAGQPANFFAGMFSGEFIMPNCGIECRIPHHWYESLPDFTGEALMPDILVYPNIDDYRNGVDTILNAVLALTK